MQQSVHGLTNSQKQSVRAGRVSQVADIHIPVSTCVQHLTSVICRALHNSVEGNKEPAANITNINVSVLRQCFKPLHTLLGFFPVYWDTDSLVVRAANSLTFKL